MHAKIGKKTNKKQHYKNDLVNKFGSRLFTNYIVCILQDFTSHMIVRLAHTLQPACSIKKKEVKYYFLLLLVVPMVLLTGSCSKEELPFIVVTNEITAMTTNSAKSGSVLLYGGDTGTAEMGLVWSTRRDPTVNSYLGKSLLNKDDKETYVVMEGLQPATVYFVRAFAQTGSGIVYGNELSFKTYFGSVDDIEGNTYYTIKAGSQEWMSSNLMTGTYQNGDMIPNIQEPELWGDTETGALSYYNDDKNMQAIYGNLYNWYAISDERGLCPAGWRVPSDNDLKILEEFLGTPLEIINDTGLRDNYAGGKLKKTGTTHWYAPNAIATDEIGFSALPGGFRHANGRYFSLGESLNMWTSSSHNETNAWYRNIYFDNAGIHRNVFTKNSGFSVRCIRD